jgi:hypothetical protein
MSILLLERRLVIFRGFNILCLLIQPLLHNPQLASINIQVTNVVLCYMFGYNVNVRASEECFLFDKRLIGLSLSQRKAVSPSS